MPLLELLLSNKYSQKSNVYKSLRALKRRGAILPPVTLNQGMQLHFHWEPAPAKMSSRATQYTHDNSKLDSFKGKQNKDGF